MWQHPRGEPFLFRAPMNCVLCLGDRVLNAFGSHPECFGDRSAANLGTCLRFLGQCLRRRVCGWSWRGCLCQVGVLRQLNVGLCGGGLQCCPNVHPMMIFSRFRFARIFGGFWCLVGGSQRCVGSRGAAGCGSALMLHLGPRIVRFLCCTCDCAVAVIVNKFMYCKLP